MNDELHAQEQAQRCRRPATYINEPGTREMLECLAAEYDGSDANASNDDEPEWFSELG